MGTTAEDMAATPHAATTAMEAPVAAMATPATTTMGEEATMTMAITTAVAVGPLPVCPTVIQTVTDPLESSHSTRACCSMHSALSCGFEGKWVRCDLRQRRILEQRCSSEPILMLKPQWADPI